MNENPTTTAPQLHSSASPFQGAFQILIISSTNHFMRTLRFKFAQSLIIWLPLSPKNIKVDLSNQRRKLDELPSKHWSDTHWWVAFWLRWRQRLSNGSLVSTPPRESSPIDLQRHFQYHILTWNQISMRFPIGLSILYSYCCEQVEYVAWHFRCFPFSFLWLPFFSSLFVNIHWI